MNNASQHKTHSNKKGTQGPQTENIVAQKHTLHANFYYMLTSAQTLNK